LRFSCYRNLTLPKEKRNPALTALDHNQFHGAAADFFDQALGCMKLKGSSFYSMPPAWPELKSSMN
jgi:hypothetical protein